MSYNEENVKTIEGLKAAIGADNVIDVKTPKDRRAYVTIKVERLRDAVTYLKEKEGITHLATITGVDLGENRQINYHFNRPNLILTLRVVVPGSNPVVPSITDLVNGATLYEREINDLLGIVPEGHPNLKRLVLSEEWPEGVHPLLKNWDVKSLRKEVDGQEWT